MAQAKADAEAKAKKRDKEKALAKIKASKENEEKFLATSPFMASMNSTAGSGIGSTTRKGFRATGRSSKKSPSQESTTP